MYLINQVVLGLLYIVVSILVCKFVFRPDVRKLKGFRVADLDETLKPLDVLQKLLAVVFALLVLGMLLPNWFPEVPFTTFLKSCTIAFVVALMVILMVLTDVSNSLVIGMITQPVIVLYCETVGMDPAPITMLLI